MSELAVFGKEIMGEGTLPRLMYTPIETANGPVPVHELLDRFYSGGHGQHMRTQPLRFGKFDYDREQKLQGLGMDVDPIGHQWEAALYGTYILEDEQRVHGELPVSRADAGLIILILGIHDMGEDTHPDILRAVGAVVGDIPTGEKTDENRAVEAAVRQWHYENTFADLPAETIARIEAVIAHRDKGILHHIYDAAHDLQAYATALKAKEAKERGLKAVSIAGATTLANLKAINATGRLYDEVHRSTGPFVKERASKFAFGKTFIKFHGLPFGASQVIEDATPSQSLQQAA